MDDRIAIGKIVTTQGIKGAVKVYPLTDFIDRFEQTKQVLVSHPSGKEQIMSIISARTHKDMVILQFAELEDINSAQKWVNSMLTVSREELIPLPEGRYYIFDMIGMEVWTEQGELLGTLVDVLRPGANDVYVVQLTPSMKARSSDKSSEVLLPAIYDCVKDIDIANKKMTVHLLDGLL